MTMQEQKPTEAIMTTTTTKKKTLASEMSVDQSKVIATALALQQWTPTERETLLALIIRVSIDSGRKGKPSRKAFNHGAAYALFGIFMSELLELCPPSRLAQLLQHMRIFTQYWATLALEAETARRAGNRPREHRGLSFEEQMERGAQRFEQATGIDIRAKPDAPKPHTSAAKSITPEIH